MGSGVTTLGRLLLAALACLAVGDRSRAAHYSVDIIRTDYGVPHITANDYASLGFGAAYAYAQDNLCLLADRIVTLRGERAQNFGGGETTRVAFREVNNVDSDFYFRAMMEPTRLKESFRRSPTDFQALLAGAVDGYNRFLRDTPPRRRPAECRDAPWVTDMTLDDLLRIQEDRVTQSSIGPLLDGLVSPKPPTASGVSGAPQARLVTPSEWDASGMGSNGWAFGRDVTTNGRGLLLGNPHYPWETINRFYQVHLTIPGKLDAMGATLGVPLGISIGFNKDVAWTHTVSTDRHFTFFRLDLDPSDSTTYFVDGQPLRMTRRTVSVPVRGRSAPEVRTFYDTIYGPVIATAQTPWTNAHAYAVRDANRGNYRHGGGLAFARARSVGELLQIISRNLGMTYVNTIAADRDGQVLYADITAAPNLPDAKLADCTPAGVSPELRTRGVFVLDGGRSSCNWNVAKGTPEPGLRPADLSPRMIRSDYVANSNDSYWLANARAPMRGFPVIIGPADSPLSLRSRAGLLAIERRLSGKDGRPGTRLDAVMVQDMLYENRDYAATLVLDALLPLCRRSDAARATDGASVDISDACTVLQMWDRRTNPESVGAVLFKEFWAKALRLPDLWRTPFDPKDPINTPRDLNTSGEAAERLRTALADAVQTIRNERLRLDGAYAEQHFAVRGAEHIPVPGGEGADGVLNNQVSPFDAAAGGYVPYAGSSYIQVVAFDAQGPVARGILTYSQSTDPASPHFADQTRLHAAKMLPPLPFRRADVEAHVLGRPLRLRQ